MSIVGSGVPNTVITASGPVNEATDCLNLDKSQKIGFILGDNTNFQDFTYVSLDTNRLKMDAGTTGLCGGAVFEAPGCTASDCGETGHGNDYVKNGGQDSISNAVIKDIFITGKNSKDDTSPCWWNNDWGSEDCNSAPQSALFIPWSGKGHGCTSNVKMSGVTMLKSWADSFNVHLCGNQNFTARSR
jgi:hypothetical protein